LSRQPSRYGIEQAKLSADGKMIMRSPFEHAAQSLRDAYSGKVLPPMRDYLDPLDADGAYQIQEINTQFWLKQGRVIVGRKAGLTAEAVQRQLGVNQPDFGVLFDDMRIADGGVLDPRHTIQPKAEAEIAFVLGADLAEPDTTPEQVAEAVATVHAAIEIVDSRIADWKISFADTVADNGSSAFFVLANQGQDLGGLDLEAAEMKLLVNGQVASTGRGAAALGNPLNAAAWLARTLCGRGQPLVKGDIILAGALGPMVTLSRGDRIVALIDGVGQCSFSFGREA